MTQAVIAIISNFTHTTMTPFAKLGYTNKAASSIETDERALRRERDEKALRNRHIALALKRAIQGGLVGTAVGGIGAAKEEGGMDGNEGALLGLIGGSLAGAGLGAAEGGIKRSLGLDPTLQTYLTAQRA
jgi:outer membrane lipoprotein SlyB